MKNEVGVLVCGHVFRRESPVLLVCRTGDDWQFLCGADHDDIPKVVGLNHILERDQSLLEVRNLPPEWEAERSDVNSAWRRAPST